MADDEADRTVLMGEDPAGAHGRHGVRGQGAARTRDAPAPDRVPAEGSLASGPGGASWETARLVDERRRGAGHQPSPGSARPGRGAREGAGDETRRLSPDAPQGATRRLSPDIPQDAAPARDAAGTPDDGTDDLWLPEDAGLRDDATGDASWIAGGDTAAGDAYAPAAYPTIRRQGPLAAPARDQGRSSAASGGTAAREPLDATRLAPLVRARRPERARGDAAAVPAPAPQAYGDVRRGGAERPRRTHKRARHGFLSSILWLLMLCVLAIVAARLVPASEASGRAIPELVSLVPLTLPVSALALVLALLWHRRVLAVLSAGCLAVVLWWHVGYFVPSGQISTAAESAVASAASTDDDVVRMMTLNTDNGHASAQAIVSLVSENHVEVLALQEVTDELLGELQAAGIATYLPYYVTSTTSVNDNGGFNCLFTAAPMADTSGDLVPTIMSKMCAGSVSVGGTTLRFVSAHPNSPHLGGEGLWGQGLDSIASLSGYDHAYVVLGDFNSTWDHARFRALLGETFVDAGEQAGEGFHMSFPSSQRVPALIEIDHVVYSKDAGFFVGDLANRKVDGSDHLALLATLEVQ